MLFRSCFLSLGTSAKLANSNVTNKMMNTNKLYPNAPYSEVPNERKQTISMTTVTTSTVNIIGFFIITRGFSFTNDCFKLSIAGLLAGKKYVPESACTLKTDTVTFGVMTFAVIFIVAALSFFPAHALSTIGRKRPKISVQPVV